MTGREEFFDLVDRGMAGQNIGLSIGSPKLELYMDGYLPETSYLIGAVSGAGKSSYMLWAFIYQPLIHFLNGESVERDPYWLMFNLEMTRPQIYAKLVSMYIFDKYGIQLKFKKIFSRGKDCVLEGEERNLLNECSDFLDILDQRIACYEGVLTEATYNKEVGNWIKNFGTWSGESFIKNNPNQILGVVIDHCSLIKATSGRSKKEEMDSISRNSVRFRNVCGISPIHVAQFNRSSGSDERLKQSMQDPNQNDFKDSGSLYDDSQVVFGLFSPHKYKLSKYRKYDIKMLEQVFVACFLLKSRFGPSDIMVPVGYYGDCTHFLELPKPDEIYDYSKYADPLWSLQIDNTEEKKDEQSNFKFTL